jgi:hypothetical protein
MLNGGDSLTQVVVEEHHQQLHSTIACSRATTACPSCYTGIMSTLYSDTHPKMDCLQIQLLREVPAWRKLEMLAQLNATARLLALSGLRQRHPKASEAQLRRRLAGLLLGEEKAGKVYGELEDAS